MSEYYGVQRSEDYLKHYGIPGMKWGVRKSIESLAVSQAKKKLKKAIAEGASESKVSVSVKNPSISTNKTVIKTKVKNVYKNGRNERGLTSKQAALENEWRKASKAMDEALKVRNKGLFITPKNQRAYEAARKASEDAAGRFFDSMTEKELERYHNKYLY